MEELLDLNEHETNVIRDAIYALNSSTDIHVRFNQKNIIAKEFLYLLHGLTIKDAAEVIYTLHSAMEKLRERALGMVNFSCKDIEEVVR